MYKGFGIRFYTKKDKSVFGSDFIKKCKSVFGFDVIAKMVKVCLDWILYEK